MPQHLKAFSSFFRVGTRSVASAAETYLLGLFASPKSNMLSMSEHILEAHHQWLHHMLSESKWDFDGLVSETSRQVNTLIGGTKAALLIDESAFAKKGEASARGSHGNGMDGWGRWRTAKWASSPHSRKRPRSRLSMRVCICLSVGSTIRRDSMR